MKSNTTSSKQTLKDWFSENGLTVLLTVLGWLGVLIAFYFSTNFRLSALEETSAHAKEQIDESKEWENDMEVEMGKIQTKLDLLLENFNLEYREDIPDDS